MFHNRGSIIAQYTYVIYIENDLVRLWIPAGALPVDPQSLVLRFVGFTHSACHYYSQLFSTTQIGLATTLMTINDVDNDDDDKAQIFFCYVALSRPTVKCEKTGSVFFFFFLLLLKMSDLGEEFAKICIQWLKKALVYAFWLHSARVFPI